MMPAVSHAQRLPRQPLSPNRQVTHGEESAKVGICTRPLLVAGRPL
jgi:hypothetical protein